jgi:hypothetical protein
MPIAIVSATCQLAQPVDLPPRDGATLATVLRGAFGDALVHAGLGPLHEPRSRAQRRDHPSPLVLRVRSVEADAHEPTHVCGFEFTLLFLGRAACAQREPVLAALHGMAATGLTATRVPFELTLASGFEGTLADRNAMRARDGSRHARIVLRTPMSADLLRFDAVLGEVAHELVQWDLVDRQVSEDLGKRGCDALAEQARVAAASSLLGVRVDADVTEQHIGSRRSRSNGHRFGLTGYTGAVTLEGDLCGALPWLVVLELRGAGRKKTFGLGEVQLELGETSGGFTP